MTLDPEVLVVGAGPTGLVLSLWLTRLGVRVRIVDKTAGPGTTSRALAVQARTLELYRQVGLADAVVAAGRKMGALNLWAARRPVAHATLGDMGGGLSPFPYLIIYPQDEHERLLIDRLAQGGVEVERQTELVAFEEKEARILAKLRKADGSVETCEAAFLAGCDGAHSTVREALGIGFPGGTYQHLFYVADVQARGRTMNGELHVALDTSDFLAVFPLKANGHARLIGTVREEGGLPPDHLTWADVSTRVIEWLGIDVERVNWFSTYRVHHRVAGEFRKGRAFLFGDAAHIHSPVGGQGMNTGIGDAVNAAWKMAAVLRGRADPSILDSYEPERIAFARRLVATTDQAFTAVTSDGGLARFTRLSVAPAVVPFLFRIPAVRRFMFRAVSQIAVEYRSSVLSEGAAGAVHGGDRLPWVLVDADGRDNFEPLGSVDWQVHVYGAVSEGIEAVCRHRAVPLHVFPWREGMAGAGLRHNALYLVRPDGYVGLADPGGDAVRLTSYLEKHGVSSNTRR